MAPTTPQEQSHSSRREFLGQLGLAATGGMLAPLWLPGGSVSAAEQPAARPDGKSKSPGRRPRVAAVFTELRFRSHAYNILENFFQPYLFRGKLVDPGVDVVSFYADQFPENDMARDVSKQLGVPLFDSIDKALCVGGKDLAVDAVLSIGEHGDYPTNERGQKMYPRKRFFDECVAVMERAGRYVPLFNDKHLSWRADWATEMYETSVKHGFPLMAGSSVPLAERVPPLDLPDGAEITEAVSIHGGGMEVYDFHALEVLQSFVESRAGGETGIERVELLSGELYEAAVSEGRWSGSLVDAALKAENIRGVERVKRPILGRPAYAQKEIARRPKGSHAIILTYRDGMQATILRLGSSANRWNFACRVKGEKTPRATALYNGPWGNRCLFKALSHSIQYMFQNNRQPYPVERTLLVSNVLEAAMESHEKWGKPVSNERLQVAYQPIDFTALRENGDSWKIITAESKQPADFSPGDARFLPDGKE